MSMFGVPPRAQESGIAWGYDKTHLYGSYLPTNFNSVPEYRGGNTSTVPVNTNEHLMVWMKPAAKPSFRKLWAIIHEPIAAGARLPHAHGGASLTGFQPDKHAAGHWCCGRAALVGRVCPPSRSHGQEEFIGSHEA